MRRLSVRLQAEGKRIGFIPTMGYLHQGHLSLVRRSKRECSITIVSIFVNPLQFAPNEDFDRYPRNINRDKKLLGAEDVDILFTPANEAMYPEPFLTSVSVDELTALGEGTSRPNHFRGVTTVVAKLLNIVTPDVLYLGQKDIQQAVILRNMVQDLNIPTTVWICPTVREPDGLAMSSRNIHLSTTERDNALALYKALQAAKNAIENGETDTAIIRRKMEAVFKKFPLARLDYILFADESTFTPVTRIEGKTIIALAAFLGKTRLIDNIIV